MRVLKAYTDAGALGQQTSSQLSPEAVARARKDAPARSGDVISISEEARDLIENGGACGISVTPQDATYDQRGNIMRQFDALQGDLRALSSQFAANSDDAQILSSLGGIKSQLTTLRAMV